MCLVIPSISDLVEGEIVMRGSDEHSGSLFCYVDLETRVPQDPPLRAIRTVANDALCELSSELCVIGHA